MGAFLPKGMEWVIILIVVLIIFGPKNLPKLGKAMSRGLKNLRSGLGKKKVQEGADDVADATVSNAAAVDGDEVVVETQTETVTETETGTETVTETVVETKTESEEKPVATKTVKRVVRKKVEK